MKIAIVSDTHDNIANFNRAIEWINKNDIEIVLHCGDIQSKETIDFAKQNLKPEIKFVKGNADWNLDLPEFIEMEFNKKRIAFVHHPGPAKKMAQSGKYDLVFYGHIHRPWDEKIGNCHMINPGELAGQFMKSTFAIYDTNTGSLELKILEKL